MIQDPLILCIIPQAGFLSSRLYHSCTTKFALLCMNYDHFFYFHYNFSTPTSRWYLLMFSAAVASQDMFSTTQFFHDECCRAAASQDTRLSPTNGMGVKDIRSSGSSPLELVVSCSSAPGPAPLLFPLSSPLAWMSSILPLSLPVPSTPSCRVPTPRIFPLVWMVTSRSPHVGWNSRTRDSCHRKAVGNGHLFVSMLKWSNLP